MKRSQFAALGLCGVCVLGGGWLLVVHDNSVAQEADYVWMASCYDADTVQFSSEFDDGIKLVPDPNAQRALLRTSAQPAVACTKSSDLGLGWASIQFEGGTEDERWAALVAEPGNSANEVLEFGLRHPSITNAMGNPVKGRVQMNAYGARGVRRLKVAVRMRLSDDFRHLRSYASTFDWLTISEWWNNAPWVTGVKYPFRISVNIIKESAAVGAPLHFQARAESRNSVKGGENETIWAVTNQQFEVPVGKWVTLEYGLLEGDASSGQFQMVATVDGKRTTIFSVQNFTHHPDELNPGGISEFNPLKLYTAARVIDRVRNQGGTLRIWWDQLSMVGCGADKTANSGPCGWSSHSSPSTPENFRAR